MHAHDLKPKRYTCGQIEAVDLTFFTYINYPDFLSVDYVYNIASMVHMFSDSVASNETNMFSQTSHFKCLYLPCEWKILSEFLSLEVLEMETHLSNFA